MAISADGLCMLASPAHHRRSRPTALALTLIVALAASLALASAPASARIGLTTHRALPKASPCSPRVLARKGPGKRQALRLRCAQSSQATASAAPSSLYWGAWLGDQLTGTEAPWDMNAAAKFESQVGKSMSMIHFAAPFADCSRNPCSFYKFPSESMERIRQHGAIPFFSWSSQSTPSSLDEPDFQLADVIDGSYDSYISEFAHEAAAWGHPFFLRFNWEMNGNWFPWAEGVNGNQPGEYVAAWRHVHDLFAAAGATNVTWTWCPNVDSEGKMADLASLYPGDEYVDWTSLDGYNWGGSEWTSFGELYGATYQRIVDKIAPSKPMVIAEVGSSENGGSKSAWIAEMLRDLPTEFRQIRGVLWFDKFVDGDWPIETSASATQAFAAGIQSSPFRGADYGNVGGGPVAPPS